LVDVKEDVKNSKSFDQAINRLNYRLAFFVAFFIATTWFMGVLITAKVIKMKVNLKLTIAITATNFGLN